MRRPECPCNVWQAAACISKPLVFDGALKRTVYALCIFDPDPAHS